MVLVDTNVVAYLLIAGDRTPAAQELFRRDSNWQSESFLLVELSNLLATQVRSGGLTQRRATSLLAVGTRLLDGRLVTVPHGDALDVAVEYRVSAYDARFLALAASRRVRLVTEDARLRSAAPDLTVGLAASLM